MTGARPTIAHVDDFVAWVEEHLTTAEGQSLRLQPLQAATIARIYDVPLALIEGDAREIHGFEGDDS